MSSTLFELVGHAEVIVRNALDAELQNSLLETRRGIPWFMLKLPGMTTRISAPEFSELELDRDGVLANITMGTWNEIVKSDEMWPYIEGAFSCDVTRNDVRARFRRAWQLRNRLAHHGSMLSVDVPAEVENILQLVSAISPGVAEWLRAKDKTIAVHGQRPVKVPDTCVVPASYAWAAYEKIAAYVCRPNRSFRPVSHLGFYFEGAIQKEIPKIVDRRDEVPWTDDYAMEMSQSSKPLDRQLANVIKYTRKHDWNHDAYQVFLLSRPAEEGHRTLRAPIAHLKTGRGSAFVQGQRYFHYAHLSSATTTDDLPQASVFSDFES